MKNLEYYMALNYKIDFIKDDAEGGYVLSIPALKGCLTCASDLEKGMEMIEDAKEQWLITALECGYNIPESGMLEGYSR